MIEQQIGYRTQPPGKNTAMRRLTLGFQLLALMSLSLLVMAGLHVMTSDISILLPVNFRVTLIGVTKYGIWAMSVIAALLAVAGFRLVTQYSPAVAGTSRQMSLIVVVLLAWELFYYILLPFFVALIVDAIRMQRTVTSQEYSLFYAVADCGAKSIHIVAMFVLTVAVVRVLRGQKLDRLAGEYWGILAASVLFIFFDAAMELWMHAAFSGSVDYQEARRIMAIRAFGTLMRMLMTIWMSIFFLRAWKKVQHLAAT